MADLGPLGESLAVSPARGEGSTTGCWRRRPGTASTAPAAPDAAARTPGGTHGAAPRHHFRRIVGGPPRSLRLATRLAATVGIAAAGTLYGVLAAGLAVRDTLVPLLLLPVLAPVLLGATRASESALGNGVGDGWSWCGLLAVFAVLYTMLGMTFFGTLLEET